MPQKLVRISDGLAADMKAIAAERNMSETQVVNEALALLRDYHYTKHKALFLNEELLSVLRASYKMAENTINNKTNKVLSEVAIQTCIQNQILANSLEVSQSDLNRYRLRAVEFLKDSQRVWRMDELADSE
ncbi:MAG: hypothetical protein RSF82_09295 [Angelakisella sp.]